MASFGREWGGSVGRPIAVRCQGHKLRLGTKLLLQTGDPVSRVETVLGKDYRTHGAMGWCQQDPCLWHSYKRAGCVVDVLVTNDDFSRANLPKKSWSVSLSKVWAIELRRPADCGVFPLENSAGMPMTFTEWIRQLDGTDLR